MITGRHKGNANSYRLHLIKYLHWLVTVAISNVLSIFDDTTIAYDLSPKFPRSYYSD